MTYEMGWSRATSHLVLFFGYKGSFYNGSPKCGAHSYSDSHRLPFCPFLETFLVPWSLYCHTIQSQNKVTLIWMQNLIAPDTTLGSHQPLLKDPDHT